MTTSTMTDILSILQSLNKCHSGMLNYDMIDNENSRRGNSGGKQGNEYSVWQVMHHRVASMKFKLSTSMFLVPFWSTVAAATTVTTVACFAMLPLWIPAEIFFYFYMLKKREKLQEVDWKCQTPYEECIWHLDCIQKSVIKLQTVYPDLKDRFVTDWFLGRKLRELTKEDAKQWMAQSFLFRNFSTLSDEDKMTTVRVADKIEEVFGHEKLFGKSFRFKEGDTCHETLAPGFNVCGKYDVTHYPFAVYLGINVFQQMASLLLMTLGFERQEQRKHGSKGGLSYYYRNVTVNETTSRKLSKPIILFHGVGTGPSTYAVLLKAIVAAHPMSPIFAVEIPHVGMNPPWTENWAEDLEEQEFCDDIEAMLMKHGFTDEDMKPVVVAHSFGCFTARWLLDHRRKIIISGAVLLDPLVFLLPYPDISKRLAAPPTNAYEFLVRRLIMREACVAYAMNRKGFWPRCCIWKEDLTRLPSDFRIEVAFSRHDLFFDSDMVVAYLDRTMDERLKHTIFDITHGEVLVRPMLLQQVAKMIHNVMYKDMTS